MRIAYVCTDRGVPIFGTKGCSVHVQEVVRALVEWGAEVHLFASKWEGFRPAGLEGLIVHPLSHISPECNDSIENMTLALNNTLSQALQDWGPFDLVYERYSLWSYGAMQYARTMDLPSILEVNSPLIEEEATHRRLENRALAERVAERVFRDAQTLVAVSEGVAEYLHGIERRQGQIHVVTNGVNPARFQEDLKPTYPGKQGEFTVGFLGSLKAWHGLRHLVEAFSLFYKRHHNSRLLIVGDGPERQKLIEDIAAQGLHEAAYLTGPVDPHEVPGLLASMDVGVAPYPTKQNFYFSPLKVYEYMAAGLPVIASRVGQIAELIENGMNGLLCRPADPKELAEMLNRLKSDPELCARLGRAARETVLRGYTWDEIVLRILRLAGLKPASPTPSKKSEKVVSMLRAVEG